MKAVSIFILLISLIALTGCSGSLKYIFIHPFDNIEYNIITQLRTETQLQIKLCPSISSSELSKLALHFKNYEQSLPYNEDNIKLSKSITELVDTIKISKSKIYCEEKLKIIDKSLKEVQIILGENR